MRTPRLVITAALGAVALMLAACSSTGTGASNGEPVEDGSIHWAIRGGNLDEGHMDPHKSQSDISAIVNRLTLDSLTYLDEEGQLHPWLATSWTVSDDQKTVTFELQENVTFHDGSEFNAEAVKANFEHVMAPETESTHANNLLGGELYESTEAIDEYTVAVHFTQPFAPFLNNTSSAFLGIYSPTVLTEHASELATGGPGISVGSGPWVMTGLTPGSTIEYERNFDYSWAPESFDTAENLAKTLEVSVVPDDQLRAERLISHEVQVASELSPQSVETLSNEEIHSEPSPGVPYSLYLNEAFGELKDKKVRQALQSGADIDAAVESVFLGHFTRADSLLSPTTPDITSNLLEGKTEFAPKQAEELLDEAGWTLADGQSVREKNGKPLELSWISWTPRDDNQQAIADLLISDWKKIGVKVTNEVLEPGAYNERYGSGEYDIVDWSFAANDPDILRNHLLTTGFQNASHVADPMIDKQLNTAAGSFDDAERTKIYDELQTWNHDYVAILPLYNPSKISANNSDIAGLIFDGNGWPIFVNAQETN